jgi:hypothetical protein
MNLIAAVFSPYSLIPETFPDEPEVYALKETND